MTADMEITLLHTLFLSEAQDKIDNYHQNTKKFYQIFVFSDIHKINFGLSKIYFVILCVYWRKP